MASLKAYLYHESPPIVNQTRSTLALAESAFDRGDLVAAGSWLTRAYTEQLVCMNEWYGVTPHEWRRRRLSSLIDSLRSAGVIDRDDNEWFRSLVGVCISAAKLRSFDKDCLMSSLRMLPDICATWPCAHIFDRRDISTVRQGGAL